MATKKIKTTAPKAAAGESAKGAHQHVDALEHKADERSFIPSREEAGMESDAVAGRPRARAVPLNPVVHRGQDPELYWLGKYGERDDQKALEIDIRSLYRHEHIAPETLIARLYRLRSRDDTQHELFVNELHGNPLALDEEQKPGAYYHRKDKWQNRLIQGDSLLVMTSLLEREGMAGQVQCIYIDPPYGIKYGSNWQMRLNDRAMPNTDPDDALSGEPEVIKAFRDTWELGIHSYLSYLRDRLLLAKEMLSASGSCFVQINDENVHLVRNLLDEVFGSENFVVSIVFKKKSATVPTEAVHDVILWVARDKANMKLRPLFLKRGSPEGDAKFNTLISPAGEMTRVAKLNESEVARLLSAGWRWARVNYPLVSQDRNERSRDFVWNGKSFSCSANRHWTYDPDNAMKRLAELGRIFDGGGKSLGGVVFWDDWPYLSLSNVWDDLHGDPDPVYVVQTTYKAVARCLLMTTDPGDLVLDPTCGSGTSAFVAEQWGRRWITSDTSRIALNVAKTRLMTATYPWYKLADATGEDIRHGFIYETVPRVTLKSIADGEPPETNTLFDQPKKDPKKLRVAGPFTVETLQSFEPLAPDAIDAANASMDNVQRFTERIFEHLKHAGIKNGIRNETAVFNRVDLINEDSGALHAEGWWSGAKGEKKAYFHIGPQFGTVSRHAVNTAIRACRDRADADWLVILGFGFESDIENRNITLKVGSFEVTKVRMHDDLMQEGLIKKDKKAASFVTIGEPEIGLLDCALPDGRAGKQVEIRGLDIYDPIKDEVKPRSAADINYWMVDDDYDGANFIARQVFFCGGDEDAFDKFKRGLSNLAAAGLKAKAERTLRVEIDDEAFARVYGFRSHPIPVEKGRRVAVRVISQFGEESTKVVRL